MLVVHVCIMNAYKNVKTHLNVNHTTQNLNVEGYLKISECIQKSENSFKCKTYYTKFKYGRLFKNFFC